MQKFVVLLQFWWHVSFFVLTIDVSEHVILQLISVTNLAIKEFVILFSHEKINLAISHIYLAQISIELKEILDQKCDKCRKDNYVMHNFSNFISHCLLILY